MAPPSILRRLENIHCTRAHKVIENSKVKYGNVLLNVTGKCLEKKAPTIHVVSNNNHDIRDMVDLNAVIVGHWFNCGVHDNSQRGVTLNPTVTSMYKCYRTYRKLSAITADYKAHVNPWYTSVMSCLLIPTVINWKNCGNCYMR